MVVSKVVPSGFASVASGTTYGFTSDVASAGPLYRVPMMTKHSAVNAASMKANRPRRCQLKEGIYTSLIYGVFRRSGSELAIVRSCVSGRNDPSERKRD